MASSAGRCSAATETAIEFPSEPSSAGGDAPDTVLWIGTKAALEAAHAKRPLVSSDAVWKRLLKGGSTFVDDDTQFVVSTLPDAPSRNQHPLSVHKIGSKVASASGKSKRTLVQVHGVADAAAATAVAAAVARGIPVYTSKTKAVKKEQHDDDDDDDDDDDGEPTVISVECFDDQGAHVRDPAQAAVAKNVRRSQRWMDLPPAELTTTSWREEISEIVKDLPNVAHEEIVGDDLREQGFGGIYGVGKAAEEPPALVILEYTPPEADDSTQTVVLVGKGIIYDTGGLSLKPKTGMPGMKHDMGGAAGLLGGFLAAVELQLPKKLVLLLCLAENAIGPAAVRNDDILTMYSGKTVEINNSDAEGRLVLGDGVAYASKHYPEASYVMDMATLTGAQLVTTGKKHAGILANTVEMEGRIVAAGLQSGDLAFPMLYAPELVEQEFESKVADMKNSVKDRSNAQASCAGHFIEAHLDADYTGGWIHVDMAGPGSDAQRGTGYGVGLVVAMLKQ